MLLLFTAAQGAWAQDTYSVSLTDGTQENPATWKGKVGDATQFGNLPLENMTEGQTVTLKYSGDREVKRITAKVVVPWDGNLANIPQSALEDDNKTLIVTDGTTLYGILNKNYKITIAAGAEVTLNGVTINGVNDVDATYPWAGITCEGNATIILADDTENTVKGFYQNYPGIYVPTGKTLTIKSGSLGTGQLTASPYDGGTEESFGAGIGGGYYISCGNIDIRGGVITANGGDWASGIGSCSHANCGTINIQSGTITANGGRYAAGIGGGGSDGICGTITITSAVTSVTASKGMNAPCSIGKGYGDNASCGTVTIGGTVYWQNNDYVGNGASYLGQTTLTYQP